MRNKFFLLPLFYLFFLSLTNGLVMTVNASPYPTLWNIPLRNEHYVSRGDTLKKIETQLKEKILTLVGIEGIGKTQLAKGYAHTFYKKYDIIWWFDASQDLDPQFKEFSLAWNSKMKGEPIPTEYLSSKALVNHVKDKLRVTQKGWLLIFDSASNKDSIKEYFPETHGKSSTHILITSRDQTTWGTFLAVKKLARAESIELVQRIAGRKVERENINDLAVLIGDFPLALSQAAAYLKSCPSLTVSEYIRLFKVAHKRLWEDETKLVAQHGESLMEYKETSSTALKLAIDKIAKESQEAHDLLLFISFLAPNQIPYSLLKKFLEIHKSDVLPDQAISVLENRLFINRDDSGKSQDLSYGIHEIIQLVVRDNLDKKQKNTLIARASDPFLALLDNRVRKEEKISWENAFQHVKKLVDFAEEEICRPIGLLKLRILFLDYLLGDKRDLQEGDKQLKVVENTLEESPLHDFFYKALYHINKGNFLVWKKADYLPASNHQQKALKLLEEVEQEADQKLRALTQLAQYSLLEGDIKSAKIYLERGQVLVERAQDIPLRALYHYGKAFYSIFITAYEEGLKEIEIALNLMSKSDPCPSMTFTTELLKAELLLKMGNLQDAYKQSSESFKKAQTYFQDSKNMFCAKAMMLMATSMPDRHKPESKALDLLKSASSIFEDLAQDSKGKHRRQAWFYVLIGDIHISRKEWKIAYENYQQAEVVYDSIYKNKKLDDYSSLYMKLAFLGTKIKDEEVTHHYVKAHINTFGLDHPRTVEILACLDRQKWSVF